MTGYGEREHAMADDDDLRLAQRNLRDLAALLALPAIWVGHERDDIAVDLLRVLVNLLHLDSAWVRFGDLSGQDSIEHWHPGGNRGKVPAEFARLLREDPETWRGAEPVLEMTAEGAPIRIVRLALALPDAFGHVLVGAFRTDFPTGQELHLLRVAAGQAAVAIRVAAMVRTERTARLAAEQALAERNALMAQISKELAVPLAAIAHRLDEVHVLVVDGSPFLEQPAPIAESTPHPEPAVRPLAVAGRLTRRETEVLGLLVHGLSNKQIAAALWVSDRTIERHITGLYRKMGVTRRPEAITLALGHHDDTGISSP